MLRIAILSLLIMSALFFGQSEGLAQGETTSAIVGQVTDATNAAVAGASVTITSRETGLKRSVITDEAGRFNFPQLKPGAYSVRVEAEGFEVRQADNVVSGLGEKQSVDFELKVAQSKLTVEVSGQAPLIDRKSVV